MANGGLTMCGERNFDRILLNEFVVPCLEENYSLPEDWQTLDEYKFLKSIATYLSEQTKIELSSDERAKIEGETGVEDLSGEEIYIDVPLDRESFSSAIDDLITKAIGAEAVDWTSQEHKRKATRKQSKSDSE